MRLLSLDCTRIPRQVLVDATVDSATTAAGMVVAGQATQSGTPVRVQLEVGAQLALNITVFSILNAAVSVIYSLTLQRLATPSLIYLEVAGDTLNPAFASSFFAYSDAVHPPETTVVVTAVPYPLVPVLSMTINGHLAQSGVPLSLDQPYGPSTITVQLNGRDGFAVYTVAIDIPLPPELASLNTSVGYLLPRPLASGLYNYSILGVAPNNATSNLIARAVVPSNAVYINGALVLQGSPVQVTLARGVGLVTIVVLLPFAGTVAPALLTPGLGYNSTYFLQTLRPARAVLAPQGQAAALQRALTAARPRALLPGLALCPRVLQAAEVRAARGAAGVRPA